MSETAGNGIMLALLAAGQSRRFGDQDKLAALLHGKMLGLHAAETLSNLPVDHRIIIASDPDHPCAAGWEKMGYHIIVNEHAAEGQSTSVRCAANSAAASGASALLICLADMPYIAPQHLQNLCQTFKDGEQSKVVASSDGGKAMPPAIFPAGQITALKDLRGDQGARQLLQTAHLAAAPDGSLLDIDTPEILVAENRKGCSA
ncbi:MAG: nucleotidyltransferase family protein [Parasphingorhabdus sp.]|uniref:nucleotidyltransferase family protein n=1 Tax=Parasphingorhabdus sp. TaxID=2709688 RepID=UPI003296B4FD